MSFNLQAQQIISPSTILPELIIQQSQRSGWADAVANKAPSIKLQPGSKMVYVRGLSMRSQVAVSQSAHNNLPSASFDGQINGTPVYLLRASSTYDHHDAIAASGWGVSVDSMIDAAYRESFCVQLRNMFLHGFKSGSGEGLLNAAGVTQAIVPPSTTAQINLTTYEPDQFAKYLLTQIGALLSRLLAFGRSSRVVVVVPQRVASYMQLSGIVQLASYQLPGGGTSSVSGLLTNVSAQAGITVEYAIDDTLAGAGLNGADAILITCPERPVNGNDGTNSFASVAPSLSANNLMLVDRALPTKYTSPVANNGTNVLYEMSATCGWALVPQATTIVNIQY